METRSGSQNILTLSRNKGELLIYSDRTHHGKEEEILFAALSKKRLDVENAHLVEKLVEEHRQSRAKVKEPVI